MASSRSRILLGLLGSPIGHSATPAMHEAAGDEIGIRVLYQLIDVPGADAAALQALLAGARRFGFAGLNVTFPYKQAIVPLLDRVAPGVAAINAVNTVVLRHGALVGHNTDMTGVQAALQEGLGTVTGAVALIGAGGMGRAAAYALQGLGCQVRVFDTDGARARALADVVGGTACATAAEALDGAAGVVNGTPLGMLPNRECPIDPALLHEGLWVFDAVYFPLVTPLLAAARRRGCRTVDGGALARHQARDAFYLFTGQRAPNGVMSAAFAAHLAGRTSDAA